MAVSFPQHPHQGLYFHFPFCSKRCNYCSFYSGNFNYEDKRLYLNAMFNELQQRKDELPAALPIKTIYYGGGTPSLVNVDELCEFTSRIIDSLSTHNLQLSEFTIEVNPEDVSIDNIRKWKKVGVNRVSIGIQSFNENMLKLMNRRHNAEQALNALKMVRDNFENVSADLIFSLPMQTSDMLHDDIRAMSSLHPDHISAYMLTYEPRTVFTYRRDKGEFIVDEDVQAEMYPDLCRALDSAGYHQYEISNFSLPGKESVHNSSYWSGNPYLGIGAAAHSYDGKRKRTWVKADLRSYIRYYNMRVDNNQPDFVHEFEILDDLQLLEEYMMLRLRTKTGIEVSDMYRRFSIPIVEKIIHESEKEKEKYNTLEITDRYISLNQLGMLMSDSVILRLLECV